MHDLLECLLIIHTENPSSELFQFHLSLLPMSIPYSTCTNASITVFGTCHCITAECFITSVISINVIKQNTVLSTAHKTQVMIFYGVYAFTGLEHWTGKLD